MRISDWSSDVCSSDLRTTEHEADDVLDLAEAAIIAEPELRRLKLLDAAVEAQAAIVRLVEVALVCIEHRHCARRVRSEERRVGKEGGRTGRSRWSPDP